MCLNEREKSHTLDVFYFRASFISLRIYMCIVEKINKPLPSHGCALETEMRRTPAPTFAKQESVSVVWGKTRQIPSRSRWRVSRVGGESHSFQQQCSCGSCRPTWRRSALYWVHLSSSNLKSVNMFYICYFKRPLWVRTLEMRSSSLVAQSFCIWCPPEQIKMEWSDLYGQVSLF